MVRSTTPLRQPARGGKNSRNRTICEEQNLPSNRRCHRRRREPNHRPIRRSAGDTSRPHAGTTSTCKETEERRIYSTRTATKPSPNRCLWDLLLPYLHAGSKGTGSLPPPAAGVNGGGRDPRPRRRKVGISASLPLRFSLSLSLSTVAEGRGK